MVCQFLHISQRSPRLSDNLLASRLFSEIEFNEVVSHPCWEWILSTVLGGRASTITPLLSPLTLHSPEELG